MSAYVGSSKNLKDPKDVVARTGAPGWIPLGDAQVRVMLQGYLAHKKMPTPLGTP